jgi:predicted MFS family arabinose efflux permease
VGGCHVYTNRSGGRQGELRSPAWRGGFGLLWTAAVAAMAIFGLSGMVWNFVEVTMMQQRGPAEMLGRVSAAFRTLSMAGTPLGALCGGVVAGAWGLNAPALLAAGLFVMGVAALLPAVQRGDTGQRPHSGL